MRITLGDNQASGGAYRSSHHWLFLTDATVKANGQTIIDRGTLVLP